eukprot:4429900-Amphidinium_carterae.1
MSGQYTEEFASWVYQSVLSSSALCCPTLATVDYSQRETDRQQRFHGGRTCARARCHPEENVQCIGGVFAEDLHTAKGRAKLPLMYSAE